MHCPSCHRPAQVDAHATIAIATHGALICPNRCHATRGTLCLLPLLRRRQTMPVAVKTLVFSTGAGGKRKRALLEAALSHSISHPNIVATFAVDAHPISDGADFGAKNTGGRAKPSGPVVSCRRPVMSVWG